MKKKGPPMCWGAVWLAVLALFAHGVAAVKPAGSAPASAPEANQAQAPAPAAHPVPAEPERKVDITEYIVRGNTALDARAIETAVTRRARTLNARTWPRNP